MFLIEKHGHGRIKDFSDLVDISDTQVSQWKLRSPDSKTGKPRNISSASCRKIETNLKIATGWMDSDHEKTEANTEDTRQGNHRKYPLISFVQAGNWSEVNDPYQPGDADQWYECVKDLGENAYVLRVKGESMTNPSGVPSFPNGILIFVRPDTNVNPGDFVITKREAENAATFKQYKMVDGEPYLFAINPSWPNPYIKLKEGDRICGKVEFAGFSL